MQRIFARYKKYLGDKAFLFSSTFGALLLLISLIINHYASAYATNNASGSVEDIILSNTRVFNVDFVVNEGAFLFLVFVAILLFLEPKRIAFTLKASALFILIRSIFITLTHLAPFPTHAILDQSDIFAIFNFGGDFFFSGHTGLPFLIALIFWDEKPIRYTAIGVSLLFGTSVLLGHLHYSIDVFSAFFITYSIFHLALRLFAKDYKVLYEIDENVR
jgi:hypothetical protein